MDTHENNNQLLSATDKQFADCIRRGDDFFRIELFKSAKEMFRKALTYRDNEADTLAKIDECDRLIKRDTKRVLYVLPFIIIAVVLIICLKSGKF